MYTFDKFVKFLAVFFCCTLCNHQIQAVEITKQAEDEFTEYLEYRGFDYSVIYVIMLIARNLDAKPKSVVDILPKGIINSNENLEKIVGALERKQQDIRCAICKLFGLKEGDNNNKNVNMACGQVKRIKKRLANLLASKR
ncbi:MAG: hypothetical protein LBH49_02130 [Puniceicoccales bacterium]|jgi:hypothetical protein|nr:hypothetical protein [Puniceicoccales bacterium]